MQVLTFWSFSQFLRLQNMEVPKVLIVAMFVASLISAAITAPRSPTTIELLVNDVIPRDVNNATQEVERQTAALSLKYLLARVHCL